MITLPEINNTIFTIGPIAPRWYGLMYIIAFIAGWYILKKYNRRDELHLNKNDLLDLTLYMLIGVVVGGRLGYVWFYNASYYLANPTDIFAVWEGGMSFHGGFIGSVLCMLIFAYRKKVNFYKITDILTIPTALGIALVRIGNFINAELYGRVTDVPWCMIFPSDPTGACRHPSQIYQMLLEGFLLMAILIWIKNKKYTPGISSWSFVLGYGVFRFLVEFVREPDVQIGYYLGWITQGQLLSAPMVVLGLGMIIYIGKNYGFNHHAVVETKSPPRNKTRKRSRPKKKREKAV